LRTAVARTGGGIEPPPVVPANESVAVHLAFAEERSLMWAAPLIGLEPFLRANDNDVEAVDCQGEWTLAFQLRHNERYLAG